jgi:hypothetical protein
VGLWVGLDAVSKGGTSLPLMDVEALFRVTLKLSFCKQILIKIRANNNMASLKRFLHQIRFTIKAGICCGQ